MVIFDRGYHRGFYPRDWRQVSMNTLGLSAQVCEIILPLSSFVLLCSLLLFSVMVVRCGSHPSVIPPCFVFPFANHLPLGRGRRVGMVESSLRSDQMGLASRQRWQLVLSFPAYTFDETFGTQRCSSPCLRYLCNTSIGRELFFHFGLNWDLDVSATVTPQVLQSADF